MLAAAGRRQNGRWVGWEKKKGSCEKSRKLPGERKMLEADVVGLGHGEIDTSQDFGNFRSQGR